MLLVALSAIALLVLCTIVHYEALRLLSYALPRLRIPSRIKVVFAIVGAFAAHMFEVLLYSMTIYWLAWHHGSGMIGESEQPSLLICLYFASTTYTSLGYGDVIPTGALRFFAGSMALTGLLLIGWTAAYVFIWMERFWEGDAKKIPA
jgi:hypothetical protein